MRRPLAAHSQARLEKLLQNRAGQKDLQDKGILKDTTVAPALQAKQVCCLSLAPPTPVASI